MFLGLPPALRQPSYSAQESDQKAIRVRNVRFEELGPPQESISAGNNETIDTLQQPEDLQHGCQAPYSDESSGPISPAVDSLTPNMNQQHSLFEIARGTYPEVWYKFKRFETLSLFNLYHYQHELIELEKRITKKDVAVGRMDPDDRELLKRLLKEYRESWTRVNHVSAADQIRRSDSVVQRYICNKETQNVATGKDSRDSQESPL